MTVDPRRPLAPGIYDAPITRALDSALASLADELRETGSDASSSSTWHR